MTPPAVAIRQLAGSDLPAAAALSAAVGWNQTAADWRRLHALAARGCLGAWRGAELVGTATLVDYAGRVAWLGMVIVAAAERGRGLGGRLVEEALALAGAGGDGGGGGDGATVVGLDATDLGAPLYERAGFVTVALIDRWGGRLRPGTAPAAASRSTRTRRLTAADLPAVAALDAAVTAVDRTALLHHLLQEDDVAVHGAFTANGLAAFAALRPGREAAHLGPFIATDGEARAAVMAAVAREAAGAPVLVDVVRGEGKAELLAGAGLNVTRTLRRMTRPALPVMTAVGVVAATAFEWG